MAHLMMIITRLMNDDDEDQMESLVKVNISRELGDNNDNYDPEKSDEEEYEEVEVELVDLNSRILTDYVNLLMVIGNMLCHAIYTCLNNTNDIFFKAPALPFFLCGLYSYQICEDSSELTTTVSAAVLK